MLPFDADATVIAVPQSVRNTVTLPGELSQIADGAAKAEASVDAPASPLDLASLDFDLDWVMPSLRLRKFQ